MKLGQFTSSEPSPKIVVRIGVENMVMMVNKTATPAVMTKRMTIVTVVE